MLVSGTYPREVYQKWPIGDPVKYEDVFYAPDKLHQSSSLKQGRFAERELPPAIIRLNFDNFWIECASFTRLYRPELSILRLDVRQCDDEVYYFSDYSVRQSLVRSLITRSKIHEDVLAAFFIMLAPALEVNHIIARAPMISSRILASSDEKHIKILRDDVKSSSARCILFPVLVSPKGVCEYGTFGNHWILLCLHIVNRSWILYDSLPSTNPLRAIDSVKSNLLTLANTLGVGSPNFEYVKCTTQENGIDCGIHVCANALGIIFGISVNPFPVHANDLRRRVYMMLLLVAKLDRDCRGTRFVCPTAAEDTSMISHVSIMYLI